MHEIANEHQFEVTYVDIEEKTYTGHFQCLIQLSTLPVAVCQGSGITSKDAQSQAARNALDYLKIMTKMWTNCKYVGLMFTNLHETLFLNTFFLPYKF